MNAGRNSPPGTSCGVPGGGGIPVRSFSLSFIHIPHPLLSMPLVFVSSAAGAGAGRGGGFGLPARPHVCRYSSSRALVHHRALVRLANPKEDLLSNSCSGVFSHHGRSRFDFGCVRIVVRASSSSSSSSSEDDEGESFESTEEKIMSELTGSLMEELIAREDVQEELAKVEKAAERVEEARRDAAKLEMEMAEVEARQEAARQAERETVATSAVADAAADVLSAAATVRRAEEEMAELRRQLDGKGAGASGGGGQKWVTEGVDEDEQRIESAKAAAIAGAAGGLVALPAYAFGAGGLGPALLLGVGSDALTAALFGLTYRYALRRDVNNSMLQSGVVAAFALARASGALSVSLADGTGASGALSGTLEGLLVLFVAQRALDRAIGAGFVKPFPS